MAETNLTVRRILQVFDKWNQVEAKKQIYGLTMSATKYAVKEFFYYLTQVIGVTGALSVIKKGEDLKVRVKETIVDGKPLALEGININFPSIKKYFDTTGVNSITFYNGLTQDDLEIFFDVIAMPADSLKKENGLKGAFEKRNLKHIQVDQMKFQLLEEGEVVSKQDAGFQPGSAVVSSFGFPARQAAGMAESSEGKGESKGEKVDRDLFGSSWINYLEGKLDKKDFEESHEKCISFAKGDIKELTKILKILSSEQKEVESFLANLEQKLFDVGFPEQTIKRLKKKLSRPKKVLVSEDELARLRKIEGSLQRSLRTRTQESLGTVNKINKRLSDEKERTEAILRQISEGDIVLDKKGMILEINPAAQKVFGISSKDAHGKQLKDVLKGHHMVSMLSNWQDETDDYIPKEVKTQSLDTKTLDTIRESSVVIEDEDGRPIGVVSSLQNVVEEKEIEKRKDHILDVLGHDLKAPVFAARHSLTLLKDNQDLINQLNERDRKLFSLCEDYIAMTEKMLNKILDARQLDTGKVTLSKEQVSINKIVADTVCSLESWAKDKKISIDVIMEALPDIHADPERIYQVTTNLISNALKFTPQDGRIEIRGKEVKTETDRFIEVSVVDSGIGIDKKDLQRIFNKYEQVSLKTHKGVSGLGLGLYICKEIVELHNGKIWVESEVDKGSTFFFRLPISEEQDE